MSKLYHRKFSRQFPSYHPKSQQFTFFVEKIWNVYLALGIEISYKLICDLNPGKDVWDFWCSINKEIQDQKPHTIRAGHYVKPGDFIRPSVWSGKPYASKQIIIGPDIEVVKTWDFEYEPGLWVDESIIKINSKVKQVDEVKEIAKNDGLNIVDFAYWFAGSGIASSKRNPFTGQILCWNKSIEY